VTSASRVMPMRGSNGRSRPRNAAASTYGTAKSEGRAHASRHPPSPASLPLGTLSRQAGESFKNAIELGQQSPSPARREREQLS
jgi:hypothetical protein